MVVVDRNYFFLFNDGDTLYNNTKEEIDRFQVNGVELSMKLDIDRSKKVANDKIGPIFIYIQYLHREIRKGLEIK